MSYQPIANCKLAYDIAQYKSSVIKTALGSFSLYDDRKRACAWGSNQICVTDGSSFGCVVPPTNWKRSRKCLDCPEKYYCNSAAFYSGVYNWNAEISGVPSNTVLEGICVPQFKVPMVKYEAFLQLDTEKLYLGAKLRVSAFNSTVARKAGTLYAAYNGVGDYENSGLLSYSGTCKNCPVTADIITVVRNKTEVQAFNLSNLIDKNEIVLDVNFDIGFSSVEDGNKFVNAQKNDRIVVWYE